MRSKAAVFNISKEILSVDSFVAVLVELVVIQSITFPFCFFCEDKWHAANVSQVASNLLLLASYHLHD